MSDNDPRSLREELEIRVIALLTGELPEADADELEKILTVDESLSDFRDRMATLMGDLHNDRDEISPPAQQAPMRLSDERRREIFKREAPYQKAEPQVKKRSLRFAIIEIAAAVAILMFLGAVLIPAVGKVRYAANRGQSETHYEVAEFEAPQEERVFAINAPRPVASAPSMPPATVREKGLLERRSSEMGSDSGAYSARAMVESKQVQEFDDIEAEVVNQGYETYDLDASGGLKKRAVGERREMLGQSSSSSSMSIDQVETSWEFDFDKQTAASPPPLSEPAPVVVTAPMRSATREVALGLTGYADNSSAAAGPVDPFAAPSSGSVSRQRAAKRSTGERLDAYDAQALAEPSSKEIASSISITAGTPQNFVAWKKPVGAVNYDNGHPDYDASVDPFWDPSYGPTVGDSKNEAAKQLKDRSNAIAAADKEGQSREQMLTQVSQFWERPKVFDVESKVAASPQYVPPTIEQRQRAIVIPQVNFAGMPLSKVIETLSELSVEYDTDRVGVPLEFTPVNGVDPRVNISLRNLSLDRILQFVTQQANHELVVLDDRIQVQPQGQSSIEQMAVERLKNTAQRPKAEMATAAAPVSTFSLNVSDVSFKLAQAALETQRLPAAELIRTEEFVNSFNYGDPAPRGDEAVSLNWEIAQHPYAHNRQIVRFSLQTQAAGRAANQPLNLNLLVDNSGSMQRPDRRAILEKSLESLQSKLTDQDQLNVVVFARQPKLIANANTVATQQAAIQDALQYQPQGGTNLEAGLQVAYQTAHANYNPAASNRVILMTDGAANLGDVKADVLAQQVIEQRKQGIALDAYGIGWEDYNDALLEEITRNGDGRYAFLNSVDTAAEDFAEKLAGTLRVAAADVKVQIIWNPERVQTYRQIGYDLHQLREQDFRDNTVDAAEIGEAEAGTALYVLQLNDDPEILGGLGKLQVRYRVPATGEYVEHAWPLEMPRKIPQLQEAPASLRLAATSALFAERLADNPYAANYDFDDIEKLASDLPQAFPTQSRVVELQNMIQSANSLFTRVE